MKLWQKFNWPAQAGIQSELNAIHRMDGKDIPDWLVSSWRWSVPLNKTYVALSHYLLEDHPNVRVYSKQAVQDVLEFLYGDWRYRAKTDLKTLDPHWWRKHSSWIKPFRVGLLWGSVLADWSSVQRIAEFPLLDVGGSPDYTKEDRDYYLALACYLRDESQTRVSSLLRAIKAGKKQKPKLLSAVVEAMLNQNVASIRETLEVYLRYFRRSEFRKTQITELFSIDGTILLNLARHKGFDIPFPDQYADHLIRLKPCVVVKRR